MDGELYQLISMAARYGFAVIMLLVVFRALQITLTDGRNARLLRKWSPEAGCVGQFVVNPSRGQKRVFLPIPKEGTLGSSSKSDIRVRARGVRRCHLTFEAREGGLLIKPRENASVKLNDEFTSSQLFATDGDTITVADVKLLLVMFSDSGVINIQSDEPAQRNDTEEMFSDIWQDD